MPGRVDAVWPALLDPSDRTRYPNRFGRSRSKAAAVWGINYDRLVTVKNAYDPTDFFRHNQNITPTVNSA